MTKISSDNRVKVLRKQKGLTAAQLAYMLDASQSMVTNWENGGSESNNGSVWLRLADYFGVTVGYLTGMTKESEPPGPITPRYKIAIDTRRCWISAENLGEAIEWANKLMKTNMSSIHIFNANGRQVAASHWIDGTPKESEHPYICHQLEGHGYYLLWRI